MANEMTEAERMTRHETKLETIEMVLMRLEAKVDTWQANFVSKELLDEKLRSRDEKIERLEEEKSTNKHTLPLWAAVVLSGVAILISLWAKK
ncbi:hypothetical protein HPT25_23355 [Bacillus sp. BRMEA1]|uniref:hypothetical protein n=1 Tax=Neobacillus endophyticus TaxID=2738405 RepID=UPI00156666C5|nr:hypothetical protein [Neobacillus endophyticus]NRD80263.1 hypothetical protein [Neobacillus endophyticus]